MKNQKTPKHHRHHIDITPYTKKVKFYIELKNYVIPVMSYVFVSSFTLTNQVVIGGISLYDSLSLP